VRTTNDKKKKQEEREKKKRAIGNTEIQTQNILFFFSHIFSTRDKIVIVQAKRTCTYVCIVFCEEEAAAAGILRYCMYY